MWSAIHSWSNWATFGGLIERGSLSDQPARLLDSITIIESEAALVRAHEAEAQARRAKVRGGSSRG